MRSRAAALASAMLAGAMGLTGCAPSQGPHGPDVEKPWRPALSQLMPADADLVVHINWRRAREEHLDASLLALLREAGLSGSVTDTLAGCLTRASAVRMGARLGPSGLDGDLVVVVSGLGTARDVAPCGARGWKHTGERGGLAVYEPLAPATDRSAAALILQSATGELALVTPGQIDAMLRLLRDGPDAEAQVPGDDGVIAVETRLNEVMLPERWRARAPTMAAILRGLVRGTARVVAGDPAQVRVLLTYTDAAAAADAGARVKAVREAMGQSEREDIRAAAATAHAMLQDDALSLVFEVKRARVEGD